MENTHFPQPLLIKQFAVASSRNRTCSHKKIASKMLPASTPIMGRVQALAPAINEIIKMFEAGELKDGVETFQDKILESIESAGLMED